MPKGDWRREPKFSKRYRTALLVDAMGGGHCDEHGDYLGHGKYGLRACPFCDIEEHFRQEKAKKAVKEVNHANYQALPDGNKV